MSPKPAYLDKETLNRAILSDPPTISPHVTLLSAVAQVVKGMSVSHSQACIVVEDQQKVVGLLTQQDLFNLISQPGRLSQATVREHMSCPVITLQESDVTDCQSVLAIFQQYHISHLPIVNEHMQVVGLLTKNRIQQAVLTACVNEEALIPSSTSGQTLGDGLPPETSGLSMGQDYVDTAIQYITRETLSTVGNDFFSEFIRHLAPSLNVSHAFVTEKVNTRLRMIAFWANGQLQDPLSYDIAKTPCEMTLQSGQFYCEHSVQQEFPEDQDLVTLGVDSYLGVALRNTAGENLGNLCLLHRGPIRYPQEVTQLLLTFAARASAELIRKQANQTLTHINQLLEEKVAMRTKELALTQSAINLATEGVLLIDGTGHIVYLNESVCALLGLRKEDIINSCIADLKTNFLLYIWAHIDDFLKSKKALTFENESQGSNNELFPIEVNLNYLDIGEEEYLLAFVRDISDRKKSEEQLKSLYQESQNKTLQLQKSYQELKETQLQLIQAEKMSGLGQLVAGVAHEINNPITFITGNLGPALDYFEHLKQLISLYQEETPEPSAAIARFTSRNDIDYVLRDLPKLLTSINHGATRIEEIVQSLKTFSRLGGAECCMVDLHENIESTLVILQNRLNGRSGTPTIKVIKEYGSLPAIECYVSLLNQVFMNLLVNAIDAIEERQESEHEPFQGEILIVTEVIDEHKVRVSIHDNGTGISPDVKARIFNPFFTTKPVGIGTGMGLSLSYQIVTRNHKGELRCESLPGEGSTFSVELFRSMANLDVTASPNSE